MVGQHSVHLHTAARKSQRTSLCKCGSTYEKGGMNSSLVTSWASTSAMQTLGMDVSRQKHSSVSKWTVIDKSMYQVVRMHKNMGCGTTMDSLRETNMPKEVPQTSCKKENYSEHSNSPCALAKEPLRATPYKLYRIVGISGFSCLTSIRAIKYDFLKCSPPGKTWCRGVCCTIPAFTGDPTL